MKLKGILGGRVVAVTAGAVVLATVGATAGYAANEWGSANIRDNSLRGVDIRDGSLGPADFSAVARQRLKGERGAAGPRGLVGPRGPAGPAGPTSITQVTDLTGDWTARASDASGITLTGDGIQFGPFATQDCSVAGRDYARVDFSGLNGEPLSSLSGLSYRSQHVADGDTQGYGAIPIRVFYDDPGTAEEFDRFTFSPNTQFNIPANYGVPQGTVNEYLVTSGTARVNDDAGSNPAGELPVADIIEEFGDLEITNINFLGGCSGATQTNLRQIVTEVEVNGTTYTFGR